MAKDKAQAKQNTYEAQTLIPAIKLGIRDQARQLVAIPVALLEKNLTVKFGDTEMKLKAKEQQPLLYRKFHNKFGRGTYTLAYFYWQPDKVE